MIARISGAVLHKKAGGVILEVEGTGLGLEVQTSLHTLEDIKEASSATLYVHLAVREDALFLFGFSTEHEKSFFIRLISVGGVGPKIALSLLSGLSTAEISSAIRAGDITKLSATPGVGKKTAERIVMELRDKIPPPPQRPLPNAEEDAARSAPDASADFVQDLISALVNLGWTAAAAERSVRHALAEAPADRDFGSVLKKALKSLYR
jgi:Holliday junction DNA helicase RuvA